MNLLINTPLVYTINDTTTTKIYTLSLHDALPISLPLLNVANNLGNQLPVAVADTTTFPGSDYYEISLVEYRAQLQDRKSTRLNSSHRCISYAVFCLKKKMKNVGCVFGI